MARYYPVSPLIWTDYTARSWDDATKLLAHYLLTCPHRNLEGLFRLPLPYIADDLGWKAPKVEKAIRRLEDDGFIARDETTDVVLIRKALKYQAPKSPKQIKGALAVLSEVPKSSVHPDFIAACDKYAPSLAEALAKGIDTHSDGVPEE